MAARPYGRCLEGWFYDYRQLKNGKKKDPNGKKLSAAEQIAYLEELITKYPIDSIEDGLDENDWDNWVKLTEKIGDRCQLVGDDLFVTNVKFLQKGIQREQRRDQSHRFRGLRQLRLSGCHESREFLLREFFRFS